MILTFLAEELCEYRLFQALRHIQDPMLTERLLIQWHKSLKIPMLEYDAGSFEELHFTPYSHLVKAYSLNRLYSAQHTS